jgi:hypothetical protein
MLIGALSVPPSVQPSFFAADSAFRTATKNNLAHFKWVKAGGVKKLPAYLGLIDLFFAHDVRFKCVVIETSKLNYKVHHRGDHELGFYKFYFLLLSRLVDFDQQYLVRVHRRTDRNRGRLADLHSATNNWCRKKAGRHITPIHSVEGADYRKYTELQLVDVLLGAVGYHWERCHLREEASKSKIEICNAICKRLEKASLAFESEWREPKFNIWKWLPKKIVG